MLNLIRGFDLDLAEERAQRAYLRRVIGLALAAIALVCLAALWARYAYGQETPLYVHEQREVTVKLMPGACSDGRTLSMLATAPETYRKAHWRAIESSWLMANGSRMDFAGCWMEVDAEQASELSGGAMREAAFLLLFSDGDQFGIPKSKFGRKRGQVGT